MKSPIIIIGCSAAICAVVYRSWRTGDMRRALSSVVQSSSKCPAITADVSRDAFVQTELLSPKPVQGHTHATAASMRSAATHFARVMAAHVGGRLLSLSMSRSDQRKGIAGERQWFWAKDVNADNQHDKLTDSDIAYLCDVDYYKDMPYLMSHIVRPYLLYTVVPEEAAGTGIDNTSFYFEDNGYLTTYISGGGSYSHPLWNYGADSFLVRKTFLGITYKSAVYAVERKQVGYSRQLILLTPIREFYGIGAFLSSFILDSKTFERFNPVTFGEQGSAFVRFRVHNGKGTYYTTARTKSHLCATVEAAIDDSIATAARIGTTKFMLPTAASWLDSNSRGAAAVLTEYYRTMIPKPVPTVYPVSEAVRAYWFQPKNFEPSERPKLEAFMNPIVHGAFAPVPNKAGEEACVEGRINKLKKPEPKRSNFVDLCMIEFADLVVGEENLCPFTVEQVAEKQTSAAQKLSLAKAYVWGPFVKPVLKCFIKSEAYADVKDPRNISTYNDRDKLTMAQFALALSKHLKKFPWYGPGMNPLQVATRVSEICVGSNFVNVSDYHRMDGTITEYLRQVDRIIFMKAFKDYRTELNSLLKRNFDNFGILPNGTNFKQGSSHGSGCSATSVSQTLRAAFTAYLAFRHTEQQGGQFYTPRKAFDSIGIHLGDDGIDGDLPVQSHEWAAQRVGLVLEAGVVHNGEPGVTFLARYYSSEVWYGRLDSMCDVRRQLSKFHTTVRTGPGFSPADKLVEKARGYVATDGSTPVIGQLCKRAVAMSGNGIYRRIAGLSNWWAKFEDSVQFPNSNEDGWMDAEFSRQFPEFDREMFDVWINATRRLSDLLGPPLCCETKPPTPAVTTVVVDGDVLPARKLQEKPNTTRSAKTPAKQSKPRKGPKKENKRKIIRPRSPATDSTGSTTSSGH